MLTNQPIKPVPNDLPRRWISDDYFDLIVWHDPPESIHGFQLCYDKQDRQRAFTWTRTCGFLHTAIDDGESSCFANQTPILIADGDFPAEIVAAEFSSRSESLGKEIRDLVLSKIAAFENLAHDPSASPRNHDRL